MPTTLSIIATDRTNAFPAPAEDGQVLATITGTYSEIVRELASLGWCSWPADRFRANLVTWLNEDQQRPDAAHVRFVLA
jgi:hypothetical protein